jgi:hypothetical protein
MRDPAEYEELLNRLDRIGTHNWPHPPNKTARDAAQAIRELCAKIEGQHK